MSFSCQRMARGPGPSPAKVPSITANMPGVDILLDHQQVDQRVVDHGVRPVAVAVQQPAKGVLHRAGDGGEDVRLDRGQVDDVHAHQRLGDEDALRVDLVQHQEGLLGVVFHPLEILVVQVQAGDVVLVGDEAVLVVALAVGGVDHHGIVVHADQVGVAGALQGADHAFDLPGSGGAGRVPGLPGDVDLQAGAPVFGQGGW